MTTRDKQDQAIIAALRKNPSQVDEPLFGDGSIHLTALQHAIVMNNEELFREALEFGANIETPDPYGSTPIMIATYNERRTMSDILARRGANLKATNEIRKTLLHYAVMHGDLPLAVATLDAGVPVNIPDNEGYTPLHCAIINDEPAAVELLLSRGANPALRTRNSAEAGADMNAYDFADLFSSEIAELLAGHKNKS